MQSAVESASYSDDGSAQSSPSSYESYFELDRSDFFNSESDLASWIDNLPDIDDIMNSESLLGELGPPQRWQSPSPPPPPVIAPEWDDTGAAFSAERLRHYIPDAKVLPTIRGSLGILDNENLRIDVSNNLRLQRIYASETPILPPLLERDMLRRPALGTPKRRIDDREKLEPPSRYKYRLNATQARRVDRSGDKDYSASELFAGTGADLKKVTKPAAVPPRASGELCDFTGVLHLLSRSETPDPSDTVEAYPDPSAVEDWRRLANDIICPRAQTESTARGFQLEVLQFLEDSIDGDDMEEVYIPKLEFEADIAFDWDDSSTNSEAEDFDYDTWVAENLAL
ncbi:hypothetical protein BD309DRAFT_868142 [Dichomitus squalens]|uniref:Uncharacterized protein n=2 Tax=Dichomitus squalens TaxID=114155 RepID=A0A4Q9NKR7_9APHY|nr:uncharacterized protein DICSQDRAFT_130279 [Dichomitus squalens LYAD-421 SS1]EJF56080.1 hypothetical protein DICSQDRAFT_130279 [Dichomitus squalens LYAD-421 SS1]TBU41518.1 hypothetical protein BD309DRAFT_868142 [Dichomitus squalens]TBU54733.1 hypothetical protein BD310DRAFT_951236 [Dichomitus squalens]